MDLATPTARTRATTPRLGVNIDHVATVRNARGGGAPDPVRAAHLAVAAGADGITAHLREDRRHIRDGDIARLKQELTVPLNFEAGATREMVDIALKVQPHAVCLVPERREERTTEGGLDIIGRRDELKPMIGELSAAGIRVSLFVEADPAVMHLAAELGAPVVELHTGAYCDRHDGGAVEAARAELRRIEMAAALGRDLGLEIHAGHGLNFESVVPVARIPEIVEFNIGHFLVGEAIFTGLEAAVARMRAVILAARAEQGAPGAG